MAENESSVPTSAHWKALVICVVVVWLVFGGVIPGDEVISVPPTP